MQKIVIERPYQFIPPHRGNWWPTFAQKFRLVDYWLRKSHGVVEYECRDVHYLRESLAAGHGIMLTPNHCRPADPIVMGFPAREANTHVFAMASWHLFHQDRFSAWAIHKVGGFSINREGIDRKSMDTAIEILDTAERPLIVFPEGTTTRLNDHLMDFLDGVAFLARMAAKKRARQKPAGKVVVHPVAIKYLYQGDLFEAVHPRLSTFEQRFTWRTADDMPLVDRIRRIGRAILSLKEVEFIGHTQSGSISERCQRLVEVLLVPIEKEWLGGTKEESVVARVKSLRVAMVPELTRGELSADERLRRWENLEKIYLAQQLSCNPSGYLKEPTTVDRIMETVERLEEDLTDRVTPHAPYKVVLQFAPAIEVATQRDRGTQVDPLMVQIRQDLQVMLGRLAQESPIYEPPSRKSVPSAVTV